MKAIAKVLLVALVMGGLLTLAASPALADRGWGHHGSHSRIGFGFGPVYRPVFCPPPIMTYYRSPVYYGPPVYYSPPAYYSPPVYYSHRPPVYYSPSVVYSAPVYTPAPVYAVPAPVYVAPPPVYYPSSGVRVSVCW